MEFKRCDKGHIYSILKSKKCPYCDEVKDNKLILETYTKEEKTLVYMPTKINPVVGWLVCIDGFEKGKDYRLVDERNFIGSSDEMDVCISGDSSISKENHFSITYNSKQRIFVISPGSTNSIIYLNKRAIYETTMIESYNLIEIGDTKLIFIAYCGENFNWKI